MKFIAIAACALVLSACATADVNVARGGKIAEQAYQAFAESSVSICHSAPTGAACAKLKELDAQVIYPALVAERTGRGTVDAVLNAIALAAPLLKPK